MQTGDLNKTKGNMKFNQTKNLLLFTPSSSLPAQEKEGNGMSCLPSPKTSQPSDQGRMDILHLNLATWSIFFLLPPVHGSSGHSSYHRNQSAALQHTEQMSHPEQQEWQCGEGVDAGGGRGGGGGKAASHIQNEMFPPEGVSHSSSKVQSCRIYFFFPCCSQCTSADTDAQIFILCRMQGEWNSKG